MSHQSVAIPNGATTTSLANGTDYGFAAGVFTTNLALAHRITKRMRAGIVWISFTLSHYWLDGVIWKLRKPELAARVGIDVKSGQGA